MSEGIPRIELNDALNRSRRRRSWRKSVAVSPRLCDGVAHVTQFAGRIGLLAELHRWFDRLDQ